MNPPANPDALPSAGEPLPAITTMPGMQLLRNWIVSARLKAMPPAEEQAQIAEVAKALSASLTPAKPAEIAKMIEELAWHYPRQERPDPARQTVARDWLRDLGHLPADIIDAACTAWRRAPNQFAPTPGHILALAEPILHTRQFWARRAAELSGRPLPKIVAPKAAAPVSRKEQA